MPLQYHRGRERDDIVTMSEHKITDKKVPMHLHDGRTRVSKAASML